MKKIPDLSSSELSQAEKAYIGHLLVDAERALPEDATRLETIAATYAFSKFLTKEHDQNTLSVENLTHDLQNLGDWNVRFVRSYTKPQPIELFREAYLAQEGHEVGELLRPLLKNRDETVDVFCAMQFAIATLRNKKRKSNWVMRDCLGNQMQIYVKKSERLIDRINKPWAGLLSRHAP